MIKSESEPETAIEGEGGDSLSDGALTVLLLALLPALLDIPESSESAEQF